MSSSARWDLQSRMVALAEFRSTLRKFLHFSEEAAKKVGLTPQQHQLLLQIAAAPTVNVATIGYLAERLYMRHHSAVELCDRCSVAGLVTRKSDPSNHRHVVLELTPEGRRMLGKLSADHLRELTELGPQLIHTLQQFVA